MLKNASACVWNTQTSVEMAYTNNPTVDRLGSQRPIMAIALLVVVFATATRMAISPAAQRNIFWGNHLSAVVPEPYVR